MKAKKTKIWKDHGFFETYEEAKVQLGEAKNKFDLCKIRLIKEKKKRGWFKIKVWTAPTQKQGGKKKTKNAN